MKKRLLSLAVSALLLAALLAAVDARAVGRALARVDIAWFALAMALFIPQVLAIARRWALVAGPLAPIGGREAGRQVLASSCLNLVLPSKLGDLAKGVFLHRQGRCTLGQGLHIVVYEKLMDLAALSALMWAGWVLAPRGEAWVLATLALGAAVIAVVVAVYHVPGAEGLPARVLPARIARHPKGKRVAEFLRAGPRTGALVHAGRGRRARIIAWSLGIWLLHLAQIACFFAAAGAGVGVLEILARMPIAIFAGLLPLTVAGVGTRDWAIVAIFGGPGTDAATLAAVGLLVSLRYVVPALAGLPWIGGYLFLAKAARESINLEENTS